MIIPDLKEVLQSAANHENSHKIIIYHSRITQCPIELSYKELLALAERNSRQLLGLDIFTFGSRVLLHFEDPLDSIVWFWSVLYSGGIPIMSTPLPLDLEQREKHLDHLETVLVHPICLTRQALVSQFDGQPLQIVLPIEGIGDVTTISPDSLQWSSSVKTNCTALLMLTSGSTGNCKVVSLTHGQILSAVAGKAAIRELPEGSPFLNWIGLDHVASMIEIHVQALYLNASQVYVRPSEIITDPFVFIELISRHRISRTFTPNFFLKKLCTSWDSCEASAHALKVDIGCLRLIASGGEANVVETCVIASRLLSQLGAPKHVIVPGFGMTETCAGAIFNLDCPSSDLRQDLEFASLGTCMPGIEMRITVSPGEAITPMENQIGDLEVRGPVVFEEYFNDPVATAESFTADGWFRTGDQATIDSLGHLQLAGRRKETMIINGLKYQPHEVETAINEAEIVGVAHGFVVCFSDRPSGADTERICIAYAPTYEPEDDKGRASTNGRIVRLTALQTGARPYLVPVDASSMQQSTLGKLSRTKIKDLFEKGCYELFETLNNTAMKRFEDANYTSPASIAEARLLDIFRDTIEFENIGVNTSIFDIGINSIDLIRLKHQIEKLYTTETILISTIMANPTVHTLTTALESLHVTRPYDPVVQLSEYGEQAPLWLIHPGVGEILVFLNLANFIDDRPVYAIRARGFDGEPYFQALDEAITTYHAAIKAKQPTGPYAIAGYSYGAMLAFEVTKILEARGDEVRFLGSFNLPPHIKSRMEQLDWTYGLLHLSYFLRLIPEERAHCLAPELRTHPREKALAHISAIADKSRLEELKLTPEALARWADLSFSLQSMARDYEPSGSVATIDVFIATPLKEVATSREDWRENHMRAWSAFTRESPRFHEVDGDHYTLMAPEHVTSFHQKLRKALKARNV